MTTRLFFRANHSVVVAFCNKYQSDVIYSGWDEVEANVSFEFARKIKEWLPAIADKYQVAGQFAIGATGVSFSYANGKLEMDPLPAMYELEIDLVGADIRKHRFNRYFNLKQPVNEIHHVQLAGVSIFSLDTVCTCISNYIAPLVNICRVIAKQDGKVIWWVILQGDHLIARHDDNPPEIKIPEVYTHNTEGAKQAIRRITSASEKSRSAHHAFVLRRAAAKSLPVITNFRCMGHNAQLVVETRPVAGATLYKSGGCKGCNGQQKARRNMNNYLENRQMPDASANDLCKVFAGWRIGPAGIQKGDIVTPLIR